MHIPLITWCFTAAQGSFHAHSGNSASAMDTSTGAGAASTASAGSEKKSRAAPSSERRFGDEWVHIQPPGQRRDAHPGVNAEFKLFPDVAGSGSDMREAQRMPIDYLLICVCSLHCKELNSGQHCLAPHNKSIRVGAVGENGAEGSGVGQPGTSLMDAKTLEAMCQFFLHHTAYAGGGWGAPEDSAAAMVRDSITAASLRQVSSFSLLSISPVRQMLLAQHDRSMICSLTSCGKSCFVLHGLGTSVCALML